VSALFSQCPGDTVQTGTRKVDPAWKCKCTMAARAKQKIENLQSLSFPWLDKI